MATTLIQGGTVISTTGRQHLDLLIDDETIAALIHPGAQPFGPDLADRVDVLVNATGKYVVPGGVDVHTHMQLPFGGTTASDTFETGTYAAAMGGTTTIIDFAVQTPGTTVQDTLGLWHDKAAGNCAIDYGFHQVIGDINPQSLSAIGELIHEGVSSVKLFMAYPGVYYSTDGQILRAMQRCAEVGSLMMMHAENGIAIDELVAQHLERGETTPYYHGVSRPWQLEEEATHRAIMLADVTRVPLYVVHVSAKQALEQIATARGAGANVFAETCPQYLYLSLEEQLGAPGFTGAQWVCSTPLRSRTEGHQEELWRYIRTGDVSSVATDHCPFCMKGQKELGIGDFSKIPNGIGGVEHRMDLMYQGVVDGRISLEKWVQVCSTEPARMFGMYPRKGVIAPGADADVVIYDPDARTEIGLGKTHHMNMDHSAWEGFTVDGGVDTVFSRGRRIVEKGAYSGSRTHGRFVRRGLSQNLI